MRFLKLFFGLALLLTILVGVIFVAVVEVTIRYGAWDLRQDLQRVTMFAADPPSDHFRRCTETLKTDPETPNQQRPLPGTPIYPLLAYQLRFTSSTEYVIEVVCNRKPVKVLSLETGKLSRGLVKIAGSGIRVPIRKANESYRDVTGLVRLGFGYRVLDVGLVEGSPKWLTGDKTNPLNEGVYIPATTCEGWGYRCCYPALEMGEGQQEPRATDCPSICYTHCGQRPVLIFFNTDPVLDYRSRTLTVFGPEVLVSFGYEVIDADSALTSVVIDFGDGETHETGMSKGLVQHTYRCGERECLFEARIRATDVTGYTMGDSRSETVMIVMRRD
jgi:hypothetical protein